MSKIPCVRCGKVWEENTHRTDGRLCDECKREEEQNVIKINVSLDLSEQIHALETIRNFLVSPLPKTLKK